jgi:hypothetical protein
MKILVLLLSLALSILAHADDQPAANSYVVESIPFSLKEGKTLDDFMALSGDFAQVAQSGDIQYSAFVIVPHFIAKSSAPVAGDYDAVWLGFSPSGATLALGLTTYLENGQALEAKFDDVRINNQRSLMRGETIHQGETASSGGFGLFRTCSLNDGADIDDLRSALKARSAALADAGSTATSHMWFGGIGVPADLQGAVILARIFPSVVAWGKGYDMYAANDFSEVEAGLAAVATCGPMRTYMGMPFYAANPN